MTKRMLFRAAALAFAVVLFLPASALEVWFLRHGETSWNRAKVLQGAIGYTDLTPKGVKMAEETGARLAAEGLRFDRAYTSPLLRTRHTAAAVCGPLGLVPREDARIQEMNFGIYQGVRYDPKTCADANLRAFYEDYEKYEPRGEGAETIAQVLKRVRDFLEREIMPLDGKADRVLCVTHGLVMNALVNEYAAVDDPIRKGPAIKRNCCVHVLELKGGEFRMKASGKTYYDVAKFDAMTMPRLVAHRGAADLTMAEATRAAYSNAVACVADIVKLDLQMTRDGVPVTSHDHTLGRTMGWDVKIGDADYAEICARGRFHAKGGFPEETIVRLDEALAIAYPVPEFWLDFKMFSPAFAERVLAEFKRAGIDESRLMVATFTRKALDYFKEAHPNIRRVAHVGFGATAGTVMCEGRAYATKAEALADLKARYGLYGVNLPADRYETEANFVTHEDLAAIKPLGLWTSLWFVQDGARAQYYAGAGADAFVTDHMTPVRAALFAEAGF